jgi:hypothetical protein
MESTSGRGVDQASHLAQRLKKSRAISTPPLGLHGLFEGELYFHGDDVRLSVTHYHRLNCWTDFDQIRHKTCLRKLSIKRSSVTVGSATLTLY